MTRIGRISGLSVRRSHRVSVEPYHGSKMSSKLFTPAMEMRIEYFRCQIQAFKIQWHFYLILAFFFQLKFFLTFDSMCKFILLRPTTFVFNIVHIRGSSTFKNDPLWPICRRVHSRLSTFCIFLTYFGLK